MQKILKLVLALAITFSFVTSLHAETPTPQFRNLNLEIDVLPGARVFSADIGPVHIVGADVGPLDGVPMVLINGYSSNFPYLAPFIKKMNERNFRVFVYNPPGQGVGPIESGVGVDEELLGINGMLVATRAVVNYAYEQGGGHEVVLAGHSLGGMQARLGSLGVLDSHEMDAHITPKSQKELRDKIALIVPMFSPPLYDPHKNFKSKEAHVDMLMTYMPYMMKHRQWIEKHFPMLLRLTPNWPIFQYVALRQNAELRGLFGAPDLDRDALGEVMEYLTFDNINISSQIVADFKRWAQNKRVDTTDGFDLVAAWIEQQEDPKTHIPTLHIIGSHDVLVDPDHAKEEAKGLGNDVLEVEAGHAGAYYDKYLANEMADAITDKYNALIKCQELLARPRARRTGTR